MACARFETFIFLKSCRKRSFVINGVLTEHFFWWCAVPSNSTLRPMTNYAFKCFCVIFYLHFALFFSYIIFTLSLSFFLKTLICHIIHFLNFIKSWCTNCNEKKDIQFDENQYIFWGDMNAVRNTNKYLRKNSS